jgi:endonuclease/exonuclease/phosphatase (EEP) superfamily protein YafD
MDSDLPAPRHEPAVEGGVGRRQRLARWASISMLVGAALIHPLAVVVARWDWRADLLTHFSGLALAVTLGSALVLALGRRRLALGLVCLAAYQAVPLFRYSGSNPVPPAPDTSARLRVLEANVLVDNTNYADLERLIRRERPDVVALVELTPEWVEGLAPVRGEYPYRVDEPTGTSGLALWFRERPEVLDPPARPMPGAAPYLHAVFRFGGRRRHLWLIHPTMPLVRKDRPELPALAAIVGRTPGSRVVIGDMNSTEGSPWFSDFLRASGLRDSRLGFGRQPSWPTWSPYRIALEHAFLSDDLAVVARRLGPTVGSDHFPLILDLAPSASAGPAGRGGEGEGEEARKVTSHSGGPPGKGG